ncbi:hypothetical protein EDB19DRAFT_1963664 [Suillus lakei]|nr:hypothetical protein EDB19DRAFT_1963664 [Suillus lakei]
MSFAPSSSPSPATVSALPPMTCLSPPSSTPPPTKLRPPADQPTDVVTLFARTVSSEYLLARSRYPIQFNRDAVDILVRIFGLRHDRNTVVGGAAIHGVSGGEKKRVLIAEALPCRALIGARDNSTRGLDASTALEFVQTLHIGTDIAHLTTVMSIYQAGE